MRWCAPRRGGEDDEIRRCESLLLPCVRSSSEAEGRGGGLRRRCCVRPRAAATDGQGGRGEPESSQRRNGREQQERMT